MYLFFVANLQKSLKYAIIMVLLNIEGSINHGKNNSINSTEG